METTYSQDDAMMYFFTLIYICHVLLDICEGRHSPPQCKLHWHHFQSISTFNAKSDLDLLFYNSSKIFQAAIWFLKYLITQNTHLFWNTPLDEFFFKH